MASLKMDRLIDSQLLILLFSISNLLEIQKTATAQSLHYFLNQLFNFVYFLALILSTLLLTDRGLILKTKLTYLKIKFFCDPFTLNQKKTHGLLKKKILVTLNSLLVHADLYFNLCKVRWI